MDLLAYEMAERALNKENQSRRKMRQSQVRVQTHEWMEKNRRKYQEEKERQIKMITAVLTSDVQAKAVENIELMEKMHDLCAAEVGAAHRAAANLPNYDEVKTLKNRENTVRALSRGQQALLQEKQATERAQQAVKKAQILRENVRKAEDYRFREYAARQLHVTKSQAAVDRIVNKLRNKQNENRRHPEYQPSLAKSLRVPKVANSEAKIGKGSKKFERVIDKKLKSVTYYDSSKPQGVLKYPPPAGLVQRHGHNSPTMNAFENAKKTAEEQHRRERKSNSIQAQRAKEVQKRGKSALKVEKLQRQLNDIMNDLRSPLEIINELNESSPAETKNDLGSSLPKNINDLKSPPKNIIDLKSPPKNDLSSPPRNNLINSPPKTTGDLRSPPHPPFEIINDLKTPLADRASRSNSRSSSIRTLSLVDSTEELDGEEHHPLHDVYSPPDNTKNFPVTSTPATDSTDNSRTTTATSGSYSPRTAAKRKRALNHYIKRLLQMCPDSMKSLAISSSSTSVSSRVEIPSSGASSSALSDVNSSSSIGIGSSCNEQGTTLSSVTEEDEDEEEKYQLNQASTSGETLAKVKVIAVSPRTRHK